MRQDKKPPESKTGQYESRKGNRTWRDRKFWFCSKEMGRNCKDKWREHHPKDCDPDYYKKRRAQGDGGGKGKKPTIKAFATLKDEEDSP